MLKLVLYSKYISGIRFVSALVVSITRIYTNSVCSPLATVSMFAERDITITVLFILMHKTFM